MDRYALLIQDMLVDKTFIPSRGDVKKLQDGASQKVRTIHKPNYFPDQIIHWCLMLQIEPLMMRGMYEYNCGSVPGRGTGFGRKTVRKWLDNDKRNTKYCFKMDVEKFYPSVNNEVLKRMLRRVIKDKDCLWLIDVIIDCDDGLPIGYFTSQWFSNFFLQGLDHFIKQELGVKYYIRYVDDLVLLGPNKKRLHAARKRIAEFLAGIDLKIKGDWQVFHIAHRAIDYLGFRFFRNRTTLRKRNALRIMRRMRRMSKKSYLNQKDASAVISYWGWIKYSDSYYFYQTHVKPYMTIKEAKRAVSNYAKIRNDKERRINHEQQALGGLQTHSICRDSRV